MNKLEKYKNIINEDFKEYVFIDYIKSGSFEKGERVNKPSLKLKCKHCNNMFIIRVDSFINRGSRCGHCCGSYEKSFAYHIEKELGLNISDVWDFEKNVVNPYHISRNFSKSKVWIKCVKNFEHNSYKTSCSQFIRGQRCPYCYGKKVCNETSFAQYHINNTDPLFLEKYWDWDRNNELGINPWKIPPNSNKYKVWVRCQSQVKNNSNKTTKSTYHESYLVSCNNFTQGKRCPYCASRPNKIKVYDSFGYNNPTIAQMWSQDNKISPYKVAKNSNSAFKFVCDICQEEFEKTIDLISSKGMSCPHCSQSNGEKKINDWLTSNNINFIYDQPYFKDLIGLGGGILRPDFILPDHKIWIEYDGEFHYGDGISMKKQSEFQLYKQQQHDVIKEEYAILNNWDMIRIAYWDKDIIEDILDGRILGLVSNKYIGIYRKDYDK